MCMVACVVNLHMLFVGLGSVAANVERDYAEAGAEHAEEGTEPRHDVNTQLQLETDVAAKKAAAPSAACRTS